MSKEEENTEQLLEKVKDDIEKEKHSDVEDKTNTEPTEETYWE